MSHDPNDCFDWDEPKIKRANIETLDGAAQFFEEIATMSEPSPLIMSHAIRSEINHAQVLEAMLTDLNALCNEVGVLGGENRVAGLRRIFVQQLDALGKASQLASIASDWNLDEVEIDGAMIGIRDLQAVFDKAIGQPRSPAA